jgi:hypothetical protein
MCTLLPHKKESVHMEEPYGSLTLRQGNGTLHSNHTLSMLLVLLLSRSLLTRAPTQTPTLNMEP